MNCTSKEQDTCRVEKQGCEGCYYHVAIPKMMQRTITNYIKENKNANKQQKKRSKR